MRYSVSVIVSAVLMNLIVISASPGGELQVRYSDPAIVSTMQMISLAIYFHTAVPGGGLQS